MLSKWRCISCVVKGIVMVAASCRRWPELKCGLCEHHLKCQNNHQHDCGHLRKEEEGDPSPGHCLSVFLPVYSRYFVWTRPGINVMVDWVLRNSYLSSPIQGCGVDRTSETAKWWWYTFAGTWTASLCHGCWDQQYLNTHSLTICLCWFSWIWNLKSNSVSCLQTVLSWLAGSVSVVRRKQNILRLKSGQFYGDCCLNVIVSTNDAMDSCSPHHVYTGNTSWDFSVWSDLW